MTTIHFFGKPDTFEIYEGSENGYHRIFDSFIEPEIKIDNKSDYVIKRFVKNGFSYLQLYMFAQSFNSGRGGIVIGVGLKSDRLFELNIKSFEKLEGILSDFKKEVLNDIEFKENTLANYFGTKKYNFHNVLQDIAYSNDPIPNSSTQSILLYLDNINRGIRALPKEINGLKSIYIVSNLDIYMSSINSSILHENANEIYTLSNDYKIVKYKEETPIKQKPKKAIQKEDEDEFETKKLQNDVLALKSKNVSIKNELQEYKSWAKRRIKILSVLSILLLLTTIGMIFKQYYLQKKDAIPTIENELEDNALADTQIINDTQNIDTLNQKNTTTPTLIDSNKNVKNSDSINYTVGEGDYNIGIVLKKLNAQYKVSISEEKFASDNKLKKERLKNGDMGYKDFNIGDKLVFKLK